MQTHKLHNCLKDAIIDLSCSEKPLPQRVAECFAKDLNQMKIDQFPEYLQNEVRQLLENLEVRTNNKPSIDPPDLQRKLSPEQAQLVIRELIRLLCEIETHRTPDDPTCMGLNPRSSEKIENPKYTEWIRPWMEAAKK